MDCDLVGFTCGGDLRVGLPLVAWLIRTYLPQGAVRDLPEIIPTESRHKTRFVTMTEEIQELDCLNPTPVAFFREWAS